MTELEFEKERLEKTVSLAEKQLEQAILENEGNSEEIIALKKEMRENATHSVSNLYSSENFEDLVALSQYSNPIIQKVADYETVANRIVMLKRVINSSYFARIDFKVNDKTVVDNIYIGRTALMEEESLERYVYDWRSPIASMFYRFAVGAASYDAPVGRISGEISLKRQYEIKNSVLEYFFDADVEIIDEFLRQLLSQNTTSKMKTIVETIQREQDIVIRDMKNDLMMVQGVAGSGKTSIALHRVAYLMYKGMSAKLTSNNIIIISPNTLFEEYISNVLPELGESNVVSRVFDEILTGILRRKYVQTRNEFLEFLIGGQSDLAKNSIKYKSLAGFSRMIERFIDDIEIDFYDVYYGKYCIASKEVLKDKFLSTRKNTPLGVRLKQIEDFVMEVAKEYHKQYANRKEYFRIKKDIKQVTELDVEYLYSKLLCNIDCDEEILNFTQENLYSNMLWYDDAVAIAFMKLKINGVGEYKDIKQVVIDEAQDYYPLHYEIFNLLFPKAQYTILGDFNQTLEKKEDMSIYNQISEILKKEKSTLVVMDKSFRCTNEILNFSSKFIPQSLEVKSFNRKGDEPQVYVAKSRSVLCDMIASETEYCLNKGYRSIGLICKTEKTAIDLFESLKDKIDVRMVKAETLEGIFIIPVYMAKGLEFDAVLICDVTQENYNREDDRNLLYIACTRALHRLNLFCEGDVSSLV